MAELYHIKKKKDKGGSETHGKSINDGLNGISNLGKTAKNLTNKIQSSSDYQKVKLAQKVKKNISDNKSSIGNTFSNFASSLSTTGNKISRQAKTTANAVKKGYHNSKINIYEEPYVSDEYQQELAYNSQKNIYPEEMNEPKKLRKKLNKTRLREIVGPKGRK
jgi:hypothetical protein